MPQPSMEPDREDEVYWRNPDPDPFAVVTIPCSDCGAEFDTGACDGQSLCDACQRAADAALDARAAALGIVRSADAVGTVYTVPCQRCGAAVRRRLFPFDPVWCSNECRQASETASR